MLKNTLINRKATIKVAQALGELNEKVVFVGGAMVSLYINDQAAEDIRPTKDIDIAFQIATVGKLEALREKLVEKGFTQTQEEKVICRFKYEDLQIDVMSTEDVGWAPSNRWFKPGFERAIFYNLDKVKIKILPLPYFLAAKMDAFFDRGIKDIYASSDLEDIVYIFNYTSDLVEQMAASEQEVSQYLNDCATKILDSDKIRSAIPGHLHFDGLEERMQIILEKMRKIAQGIRP
jgi:predicted nucleotidyltransferase